MKMIKNKLKNLTERYLAQGIVFLVTVTVCCVFAFMHDALTLSTGNDEISTLASAAFFGGCDWSEVISQTSYYGFGYGLIWSPVFRLVNDPVSIYRLILCINGIFVGASAVIAYAIQNKIDVKYGRWRKVLISFVSVCFCECLFNTMVAVNETFLSFLIWLILYLLLCLWDCGDEKRKKRLSFFLALGLAYGQFIHSRILIVYISVALAVLFVGFIKRRHIVSYKVFLPFFMIFYWAAQVLTDMVQRSLWLKDSGQVLSNSVPSALSNLENLKLMTEGNGVKAFLLSFFGQFYTASLATGGLFLICILSVFVLLWRCLKSRRQAGENPKLMILGIVSLSGVVISVILIALSGLDNIVTGMDKNLATNFKWFFYVRYMSIFVGPLILCGLYALEGKGRRLKGILVGSALTGIALIGFSLIFLAKYMDGVPVKYSNVFKILSPYTLLSGQDTFSVGSFWQAGIVLAVCLLCCVILFYLGKNRVIYIFYIIFSLYSMTYVEKIYQIPNSQMIYDLEDTTVEIVRSVVEENHLKKVVYLKSDMDRNRRNSVLFQLYDYKIYNRAKLQHIGEAIIICEDMTNPIDGAVYYKVDSEGYIAVLGEDYNKIFRDYFQSSSN